MDSGVIRNHISPAVVKRMGLFDKQKQNLYLLVTISEDPILYKDGIIYFKTRPVKIEIKGWKLVILFNILLLGREKAVLKILFLQEFNPKIDWITEEVEI